MYVVELGHCGRTWFVDGREHGRSGHPKFLAVKRRFGEQLKILQTLFVEQQFVDLSCEHIGNRVGMFDGLRDPINWL